jgi:hypothetical protein
MKRNACSLCDESSETISRGLCEACSRMDERLDQLIRNRPELLNRYLVDKYIAAVNLEPQLFDRRTQPCHPPRGIHTPERRVRIRRTCNLPWSPKRRKTD